MTITLGTIVPSALLLVVISALGYLLANPDKVDKWSNIFSRLIFWSRDQRERRLISTNLDYRVTSAAKRINREAEGILPFGLRIKWRDPEEATSYVENNEVVVVLHKDDNSDKNIVQACLAYVPMALIPKSRNVVDQILLESMDNFVTRKILSDGEYASAYNYYVKTVLDDLLTRNNRFSALFEAVGKIDGTGLFTRVLLEEFRLLGDQLYGTLEETAYKAETVAFLDFLLKIATRQPGDDTTPLSFSGQKINIGIVLFAKQDTLTHVGLEAYVRRIERDYNRGAQRIFLFSYAQRKDQIQYDAEGFVVGFRKRSDFSGLDSIERRCGQLSYLRFLKKQVYYTRDAGGKNRTAKYYVYECLH